MATFNFREIRNQLEEFSDITIEEMNKITRGAVTVGANIIGNQARKNLQAKVKGAMGQMPEGGNLYQGIRIFTWKQAPAATVQIYGNTTTNDGTWRLRFFEGGTKDRYQKIRSKPENGRKRGKVVAKKYLGKIQPTWFFKDAIEQVQSQVDSSVVEYINKKMSQVVNEKFN